MCVCCLCVAGHDDIIWALLCDWLLRVFELADIQRVTELLLLLMKMKVWVLLLILSLVPCVSADGESLIYS